jgi:hypothetical protein
LSEFPVASRNSASISTGWLGQSNKPRGAKRTSRNRNGPEFSVIAATAIWQQAAYETKKKVANLGHKHIT